jgi:hypothetical protein
MTIEYFVNCIIFGMYDFGKISRILDRSLQDLKAPAETDLKKLLSGPYDTIFKMLDKAGLFQ